MEQKRKVENVQLRVDKLLKAAKDLASAIRIVKRELPGDYLLDSMAKLVNDEIQEVEKALAELREN